MVSRSGWGIIAASLDIIHPDVYLQDAYDGLGLMARIRRPRMAAVGMGMLFFKRDMAIWKE